MVVLNGRFWVLGSGFCRTGLVAILLLLSGAFSPVQVTGTGGPIQPVRIKAKRFKFVPSRISVKVGTTLEIALSSQDVRHGFRIVGSDIDVEIPARGKGPATVMFRADQAGQFRFECSRVCGAGHSSMRGVIQVTKHKKGQETDPEKRGNRP